MDVWAKILGDEGCKVVGSETKREMQVLVLEHENMVLTATVSPSKVAWLEIASGSKNIAEEFWQKVSQRLEIPEELADEAVALNFWTQGSHQPLSRERKIHVPRWDDIRQNYPISVRPKLERLMDLSHPTESGAGKLILLHGPPGTGKTHAIRALCQRWKPWANSQYIVDPEAFFGNAAYLVHVLLNDDTVEEEEWDEFLDLKIKSDPTDEKSDLQKRWRVLIAEDVDEFIHADAKEKSGQALSRLLNTTDGLIGQGLRILVLLTTNENIENLHPAIAREGRCLANLHFGPFERREAQGWLQHHNIPDRFAENEMTLAKLYETSRAAHQIVAERQEQTTGLYL